MEVGDERSVHEASSSPLNPFSELREVRSGDAPFGDAFDTGSSSLGTM
jgi:hypothetical protein